MMIKAKNKHVGKLCINDDDHCFQQNTGGWWGCLWILDCRKQAIKEVESDIMFRMSGRNTLRKLRKEGGWGSMPSEVFEPLEAALAVLEEDLKNDKKDS